jgi:hypothetical protein
LNDLFEDLRFCFTVAGAVGVFLGLVITITILMLLALAIFAFGLFTICVMIFG